MKKWVFRLMFAGFALIALSLVYGIMLGHTGAGIVICGLSLVCFSLVIYIDIRQMGRARHRSSDHVTVVPSRLFDELMRDDMHDVYDDEEEL